MKSGSWASEGMELKNILKASLAITYLEEMQQP